MVVGHFYFLRSEYFEKFPSTNLMNNHSAETGLHNRPYFIAFKENENVFWAVPISSKVRKFADMYARKVARHKRCDTIDFCDILGRKKAVLIQNMIPVSDEYVLNEYADPNDNPVQIAHKDNKRIVRKAKKVLELQRKGYDLIFSDVFEILKLL